jgi:acetyltransferase-like isoleucine patch superfamily enzyme
MKKKIIGFNPVRDKGIVLKLFIYAYAVSGKKFRNKLQGILYHYQGPCFQFYSNTLRQIVKKYHNIEVGLYTHGGCFNPESMPPGTKIGRYSSIAHGVSILENHPQNLISTHAFFFNPYMGYVEKDITQKSNLTIGNDVWIGQNAIILPGCSSIGDGAIIGAGSVLNKDIPPYAIALGNPCRVIGYRFSQSKIEELLSSKWWEKSIDELLPDINKFQMIVEGAPE